MSDVPPENLYHRSLGWHAPALRRAVTVAVIWLISSLVLLRFVPWELAVVLGWDTAALVFLMSTWHIIIRAGSGQTALLAGREDQRRGIAAVLLIGARARHPASRRRRVQPCRPAPASRFHLSRNGEPGWHVL